MASSPPPAPQRPVSEWVSIFGAFALGIGFLFQTATTYVHVSDDTAAIVELRQNNKETAAEIKAMSVQLAAMQADVDQLLHKEPQR